MSTYHILTGDADVVPCNNVTIQERRAAIRALDHAIPLHTTCTQAYIHTFQQQRAPRQRLRCGPVNLLASVDGLHARLHVRALQTLVDTLSNAMI